MTGQITQRPISILILAAGASSRMRGMDKLLEPVQGLPLLRHAAQTALKTGLPVFAALGPDRPARAAALDGLGLQQVLVADACIGMGASLQSGISAIAPDHAIMVLLADMPDLDAADLAAMISAYRLAPGAIHRGCTADGKPGHPVVFPPWVRDDLLQVTGDMGAKPVLQAHASNIRLVPLPGNHALTDLDTPEDWATWRKAGP